MNLISLEDFYTDLYPLVPGCPEMIIENAVRASVLSFCEQSGIIQHEMDPVTIVAGIAEYDFEAPNELIVDKIIVANFNSRSLDVLSPRMVEERFPRHRSVDGSPEGIMRIDGSIFKLYPTPHTTVASALFLTVALKPEPGSEYAPEILMQDHKAAIVDGAAARLLMMPGKDWTNPAMAGSHAATFAAAVGNAKRRARRADEGATPMTSYGGIRPNRSYKRGW